MLIRTVTLYLKNKTYKVTKQTRLFHADDSKVGIYKIEYNQSVIRMIKNPFLLIVDYRYLS